jgi:DNA invertase Pin-like site-specific DNA recombinase
MKNASKSAYSYLRVSGKGQVDGDGFPRQREAVQKYAAANGLEITHEFVEKGVSGKTEWEDRPAFAEMMAALLSNGTRVVLVENLSRLARDLMVQESIIADFQRKGLTLISVSEPDLCSDDPSRTMMRQVLGAFWQYEKSMLVLKLRVARKRVRKVTGHCEGRKAYGAREGEQPILDRLHQLRSQGMALDTIAATLNAEGLKSRSGKPWFGSTLNRIHKASLRPARREAKPASKAV